MMPFHDRQVGFSGLVELVLGGFRCAGSTAFTISPAMTDKSFATFAAFDWQDFRLSLGPGVDDNIDAIADASV